MKKFDIIESGLPMNLITGATGLLGSHIIEKLIEQGQAVRALVRAI